ncbi:hypothetical protein AVEN_219305-1 [Araneus ventricosus]|uniref:Uncharacterized protein n=1 Tax=Araneus ventricosus TaxID=182803 RepID=A0A4Y2BGW2_ARAVE|nr:hypothetical protein AVEN_219305-1 [Araneus ventricosus]
MASIKEEHRSAVDGPEVRYKKSHIPICKVDVMYKRLSKAEVPYYIKNAIARNTAKPILRNKIKATGDITASIFAIDFNKDSCFLHSFAIVLFSNFVVGFSTKSNIKTQIRQYLKAVM